MIHLAFDWPDGLVLDVAWERTEWQVRDGGPRMAWSATGGFRVHTERMDGATPSWGLTVSRQRRQVTAHVNPDPGQFDRKAIIDQLKDALCSFVVDEHGQAVVLLDGALLRTGLGPPPEVRAARPDLAALFDRMTTDPALLQQAQEFWDPIVGTWAGKALEPGQARTGTTLKPMPIIGNNPVRLHTTLLATPGTEGRVDLVCDSRFDPDHLRQVSQATSVRGTGHHVLHADLSSHIELHTEPDGLVPVRASAASTREVAVQDPTGVIRRMEGVETRSWTFTAVGAPGTRGSAR